MWVKDIAHNNQIGNMLDNTKAAWWSSDVRYDQYNRNLKYIVVVVVAVISIVIVYHKWNDQRK